MLARVKCWVEYNRVKTNPTNSQKHKNLHHCSSRLALHSLPPGDICEIDHWKHCRSIPPGATPENSPRVILVVYHLAARDLPPGSNVARGLFGLFNLVFQLAQPLTLTSTHAWRRCPHTLTLQNPKSLSHSHFPNSSPNFKSLTPNLNPLSCQTPFPCLTHSHSHSTFALARRCPAETTTQSLSRTLQSLFLQHFLLHSTQVKWLSCALFILAFFLFMLLLLC